MAERPLYTLYKNLKAQNYDVPNDYNKFESALTRDGKSGADNRHAIYENLKAQNFDVPDTYERFYTALFEPRSKTSSRAKGGSVPMSAADRARFLSGAAAISASAKQIVNNAGRYNRLKQRKQKQQKDFGRVNLGTHLTPFGGDANDVVKDEFAYNPETGKAGAYVTSDNENAYTQSDAEQKQAILDKYGEEWNKAVDMGMVPSELDKADPDLSDTDVAMRQMERRQEWLDENQNRRSKELNESMHLQDSPFVASGGAVAPSSFNTAIGNEANRLSDAEYGAYNTAKAYNQMLRTTLLQELKEQKQRNEDAGWWKDKWNDVSNYFGGMFDTMLDPKLYSQGVMDAAIASNLLQVKKGMEEGTIKKGSNAGDAAQVMLSAIQQQQGEATKQQQNGTKAYQYGDVSGRSLKFMGDFALSGWRNVMTTGFTKAGEKVGEKMALGALGKWFTKNTGRVLGDMAGSAALAATNQLGSTYNNVIERYVGMNNENGGVTQDKNGDLSFNKGVSLGKAIKDGLGSATIENFSEMFGEYLPGASKLLSKLGLSKVSSFFEKIGNNAYYKWLSNATNKSGIQGVMSEIAEEEFGTALHAAWGDGDGSWSDFNVFTNPDAREKQIDTCLGMFYSVGFMQSPRTAVGAINAVRYFNLKHQVTKADKFGQMMFNDKWDEIKSKIDVTTNADLTKTVLDATRSDSMNAKQKGAVINYAMFLSKLRGFNQASDAKTKDKVEEGETAPTLSNDLDDAYTEGHNADDADKHDIQIQHEDQAKTLAVALNISEQQLSGMSDEELESLTGQDDKLDQAIYDYQLSSARYQGVVDDAQDKVDLAAHQAEQRVNMYTDQSRGSVRNATIKASGGAEDYGVYIISGNIATHEDGSIDVSNSDDMILYFDPTTNSVEHADALMFAELGEELPAADVKAQAVADAKENAIKEIAGIIDGTVEVGSQFSVTDADGTEHTYEVLADNGDGTAMITIDGNVPTELVKGENVQIPYSFADLQQMKDMEDQKRLEAAKAEREQMEKERDEQQTEETQPSFDFNKILNDDGNVVLVDVLGKDGNTKYPGSTLFLIRDAGAKAKVVELKSDGTIVPHAVNKEDVATISTMSLDEYKQAMPSSMIEDNSGENRGEIEEEAPTIEGETAEPAEETATPESAEDSATEQNPAAEQTPAITLEDGTIVPMLEDGNPDFSKLSAAQTAELYDSQFGEDADGIVSGYVSDAKKALDKANNMTVKGKTFVEQKAAKDAKEKAIADAQAAYDSAIAIRDAYNERQLAKEENTPEGRKSLIEKAKRKFARLKNSEEWSERPGDLWNETVGKLLHRLYDATGIDVFNDTPNTVYEYVAENVGPYSLNYEGNDNSKGVQQETGLSRSDFAKLGWLAAEGKGMTIDAKVHRLWENRPSNLESADTQEIRNALISLITSGQTAFQARDYIMNQRIELAESALEEQLRQEEDAAEAQKAKEEEEKKKAELEKKKAEEEKVEEEKIEDNENTEFPDKSKEESKAIEVPEDATDEKPLGEQLDESDLPFSAKDNGQQQTTAERAADVEKNKVDDMKVVDNIVGQKTRKAFERLAKMMGANIQWQYSDKLGNGWIQETTDADGNVHRTIFITLDSSITEGAQFIFGHEMTHQIKNLNPSAYNELTQLVLDTYGSDVFGKAVDETTKRYSDAGFSGRDRDYYAEEVVADAVGEMIRDLNLAHTLAMKMSHPLLAAIHEILQKIKLAFFGTEYSDVTKNIIRSIEQAYVKTAKGQVVNSETGEDVSFSLRQKPEPKKKGIGYKVFVLKDGKLYPPMVANPDGAATPVGVWLDADAAPIAGESKTGRPQVKQGGKGTQGGSGKLAYRPGWHLGVVPYAIQFNRKDAEGNKSLFPKNFVFAEVEYAADVDYQEEARQEGINPSGKYQHSLAGLKHLPTDGYYMYRTNPNPETDPWVITGAMKVNRILTRAEQAELVKNAGREPQQIQEGDIVTDDVVDSINQEIADAPKFSLKVYHGSGADFTEFDFDHMGEGAGSQVFGWGGYVTSSKKIGKSYANIVDANAPHQDVEYVGNNAHEYTDVVAGLFNGGQRDYDDVKEFLQNGYNADKENARKRQMLEWFESTKPSDWKSINDGKRNLYEVDIPDDNGRNYLKWYETLSEEQINTIRDALAKKGVDVSSWENRGFKLDLPFKDVYTAVLPMMMRCEPKEVSKFLSSLGFTGIKYPAGTIQGGAEEGDTNYVIFKPEDMKITEHTKFSIKTYHGSQASFDKFDHSFMGSGEGAQAYGWGTYVSEVEGIAKAYAKQNAAKHGMPRDYKIAQLHLNHAKFEYEKVQRAYNNSKAYIDSLKEDLQNYRDSMARRKEKVAYFAQNNMPETVDKLLKQIKRAEDTIKVTENDINMRTNDLEGWKPKLEEVKKKYEEEQKKFDAIPKPQIERNLYSVDIPDDTGENYIGWDEKMTPRMRDIRKEILEDNGYKLVDSDDMRDYFEDRDGKEYELFKEQYKTGGTFYEELAQLLHSQKLASLALKEYGFDGVKVIAERNTGGNKEGKMNYVIFDENNAQITNHTKFSLRLKSAIDETETNPSDAQKESGNYKKGHIKFGGYDYTIENPKGSTRSGKDANGKEWKVTMHDTYGYIRGKFGKDGDHLDMFINDKADLDNWDGDVFVVDQVNSDGSFDEHKVMYGYDSMDDAEKAYLANYSKGWKGLGSITGVSKDEFDKWLDTSKRKLKPFADYAKVKFSQAQSVSEPRYSLKDIKPVGVGAFGNIYNQFRGNAKAAIEFLKKVRGGEAVGALHHKDIGDIDLVWGKEGTGHSDGYGLSKLVKYHPEVLDNLQEILNDMRVVSSSKNRVNLESETHKAGVRLTWDGERKSWLLTAFKKETSASDKRTDTAATSLEGDTALSQTEGSAAKIDNSSETAKENGEKFSLKEEKTLAGVHNITEEKLLKAIKQGGLANPSVAVIDSSKQNHEDYGDISLILPSDKVAKRTGKNAGTWQGDAWTPTYPQVERQMSNKGAAKASKDVSSVPGDMYREVRRGLDRWLDGGEANSAMAYMFLYEKGLAPEPKKIQHKFSDEDYNKLKNITAGDFNIYGIGKADAQKVLDMYIDAKFGGDKDLYEEKTKDWLERNKSIVDAGNKGGMRYTIAKDNVELYDEYGFNYKSVQTFVRDVEYDHRKTGVDMNATLNEVEDYIKTNNLTDEFNTWLEGKEKEYGIKEVIFDGFTPSGNRRYVPNTLENVSKIMKKQGRNGATGISVSFQNFAASLMPSYGTLKDIRSKKGLLTSDHEDLDKFTEKWSKVFFELGMKCQPDATGTFDDYGLARLSEAAKTSDPQAYLKKEYNVDFSDEDTKRLKEMVKAIKEESPAMYFETKFERPVGFNEFSSAVVPTTASDEVKQALKNAGVQIYEYDKEKEGDRNRAFSEAINSSDNIRFSLKAMMEKPEGWKQANKKAIHIAEAIERDPKFSLKNLDGTLIKAGTYFSGGGLVEEGLKGIIDPVVAVEYDEKISGVYRNNFGQHIVTADVRDVDPKELVKQIDGEVEYFHASPVCKNYSQAKSNHVEVELDKETAASTAEFINAIKPKVVTIENVKGYKDSEAMKTITDALDANGYTWDADVYNAADYGGYTNRERLIVRAVRDGKLPEKPKKMTRKSGWYEAVADIIPTLTEKKNGVAPWMDIRLKADGIDWRNIDKPLYVMGSAYADGKVPHAFADELLPTLRTKSGDVIVMPDGKVYRAMGRVLARVSGVSDDYKMPFSENLSHTIIGNGIPTQLTEHVIAPLLTGSDPKFSIRTYHGTGAKFDKFDFSHMGEGEGSQAFGWGGYVTNSKDIAEDYTRRAKIRKDNGGFEFVTDMSANNKDMVRQYIYKHKDVNKGLDAMRKDLSSAIEMFPDDDDLKELSNILAKKNDEIAVPDNIAYLYDVDIPDDNGDYLDWENKLKKSHLNKVNKELVRIGKEPIETIYPSRVDGKVRGQDLYDELSAILGSKEAASKLLSDAGFVGIKYPAGTIFGGAKEDDYNYVIFDENNANIVGNTRFSLRYDKFEHDLNQWKKDNNLPKDAKRPTIPQRNAGESAVDFLKRVDEYRKQMALWKTAPTYEQHLLSDDTALGEFNRELQRGSVLKRIAFQDSMLAIRKAQEAIMKEVGVDRLNMAEDAYTAENRSHGKGKNEFEEYNNEFLQPLRKAYHQMKKVLGDSYDNVRLYMMAKHGLERNAQMAFKESLEADYEDVAQRSAAYKAYKGDISRMGNDSGFELGLIDYATWVREDNAIKMKYSPSYMKYRYDKMGIAFDYSGLSALFDGSDFEEAAHKLVRDIESKHIVETRELWDATNAATKKILRDGYKAGMMSKDTYQYVRDMYSHYIPLRGWDGTTADQVWDYVGGGKGAFNQTLKTAHGRTSIADDPIAYIENMAESGILLNNKNWVKQHLMLLAQNHPTSLLTLSKAWYVKSTDANGNEEWIPATPQITSQMNSNQVKAAIDAFEQKMEQMAQTGDATQKRDGLNIAYPQTHSEEREHEVRVMKDGEEYVIYVNGDPQLAQAMNNTRAHRVREIQSGKLDRAAAWLGRKMAAAYTSLSPLFIPSNYFRDLTMTLASTAIREDGRYNYLLRKNLATSWNLGFMLRDYQSGKLREKVSNGNATEKEQMFYDFMMNGGETGFVSSLDVEDLKKKFKNDLKDLDRWKANPVKVGHTIMDGIEFLNRAIEDSNRFAVYMTSIQYGRSIDEAVNDAKNVTLNFNRKGTGEYGWQMIRNLYLFINPAVQSLQTLGALGKHHPFKFTAVTASWIASGVLVPIVNAALMQIAAAFGGGDGDDKKWYKDISKKYWQFTKWDRRNNLIMWVPFTHEFIKIPLAQEFRAFYGVGDMIASNMMGGKLAKESWSQYAEDLLGQVVDMLPLDPTGYDGNIAVSLMPNAIRPVFELAFNIDFTGKPLFKETEYNKYDPNFTKAYVGTPDWLVRVSKMVNSIGNDYPDVQQNAIDAFGDPRYNLNNPGVVDHVLSSYLGGAYTMGSQVLGVLTKSLNDPKEIKVADIPLVSKFVSNPDDRPVSKKQGDEFWDKKEYYERASNTISKLKKQAKIDGDYSLLERFYGSEEYKTYKLYEKDVKDYKETRKKERAEESGDEYRPHQLNAEDIYNNHATSMDEFEDMKMKQLFEKLNSFKSRYDAIVDNAPSQSDGYYNTNKAAIDAIDEISLDKQEISELKKGFLDDGKDAYNAEDMKRIRELRKKILAVLEKANKVVVANQKAKAKKK
jgi:site-specific DNA-cytosine methylase